jgi:hypothetical protein
MWARSTCNEALRIGRVKPIGIRVLGAFPAGNSATGITFLFGVGGKAITGTGRSL